MSALCFAGHSIVECGLHSIASIAIYHSDVVDGINLSFPCIKRPYQDMAATTEIWYTVVQVASHSKNPRAHHGSQRKLPTALSSDLTSFIATNFSNDDVVHEEGRKDPPAAASPMSSPSLGNPRSDSILFGAAWRANRIAENLGADRAASGQGLSTRTFHFPDRYLHRHHHRYPVAGRGQSGSPRRLSDSIANSPIDCPLFDRRDHGSEEDSMDP
jgi:hypothetical protein